jgi:exopolysaccharide biosynthesis polyprenyl glycosylphosphotransferase
MAALEGSRDSVLANEIVVGLLPVWIVLNKLLGLYDRDAKVLFKSTLDEFPRIAVSIIVGSSALFVVVPTVSGLQVQPAAMLVFQTIALMTVPLFRTTLRAAYERRADGELCLVVGAGQVARSLADLLPTSTGRGTRIMGYVDTPADGASGKNLDIPRLGEVADFGHVCMEHGVSRIILVASSLPGDQLLPLVGAAQHLSLKVSVVADGLETMTAGELEQTGDVTLLALRGLSRPRSSLWLKRAIDSFGAAAGLVLLSPLLALIALAVKLTSPGPVLFVQRRIGYQNKPFRLYKFRTMRVGADALKPSLQRLNEASPPMFKLALDPRVTPLGRWLRRYCLDELPQLWNVLRGEMSLVGPRPLVPEEDSCVVGLHRTRLGLMPGLTGPWQVRGRTAIPFEEMLALDYTYVAHWSLWHDIKLLIRTAPIVFGGKGY